MLACLDEEFSSGSARTGVIRISSEENSGETTVTKRKTNREADPAAEETQRAPQKKDRMSKRRES